MSQRAKIYLSVAKEFSDTAGPRSRSEGDFSGEEFLERHLSVKFKEAVDAKGILVVDLDDTEGYATSFLESAFGGLVRNYGYSTQFVLAHLEFKSDDEPFLIEEIVNYIKEAKAES